MIFIKEKIWNDETRKLRVDQIDYLKPEIMVKNTLVQQLITEVSYRNRNQSSSNNDLNDQENSSMNSRRSNENDETSLTNVLIIRRKVRMKIIRSHSP